MKKQSIALLLTVALLLGVAATPAQAESGTEDVLSTWAADEVTTAIGLGMVQDTMQNNWQAEITRRDFARLAISFLAVQYGYGERPLDSFMEDYLDNGKAPLGVAFQKSDYLTEEHRTAQAQGAWFSWSAVLRDDIEVFSDVTSDGCKDQINMAYLLGIVKGVGDGRYAPDAPITRQEAATLLTRTYQVYGTLEMGQAATSYTDQEQIAPWAVENVATLSGKGVFEGDETGAFLPLGNLTKEQAVATFYRLYQGMPVSRRNGNIQPLLSPEEIAQQIQNGTHGNANEAYAQALLQSSVKDFYHRPFEELPQPLRDSLTWDGKVETMEGYNFRLRTYIGPGITIVTTEAPEDVLRNWIDLQLTLPVEQREGQATDEELEAEFQREKGREWLYSVTLTDGRYSTGLGLTVGDTVAEAEEKGYSFSSEQLQAGGATFGVPMETHLTAVVENNVVTSLHLSFGIGRYVGKYWDI